MDSRLIPASALLIFLSSAAAPAEDITLSPDGPVRTPAAARDKAAQAGKPVTILVRGGVYRLDEPLRLGPEHSRVTWKAAAGETPVFSGGEELERFTPRPDGLWELTVKPGFVFDQLWIGTRRATPARHPNNAVLLQPVEVSEEILPDQSARQSLRFRPGDLDFLKQCDAASFSGIHLLVTHKWDNTRRKSVRFDASEGRIITEGKPMKHWNRWDKDSVVHFERSASFLDQPGEWAFSEGGKILYKPYPDQEAASARATAPRLTTLVSLRGAKDVTFEGISFLHAGWVCPPGGFEPQQAAASIDAAIQGDGCSNVAFVRCEIAHTGTYGIWFRKGCTGNRIEHCHIHDTGAGGVRFGTMDIPAAPEDETSGNVLDNSIVRDGGHDFPCAVGVWIGHSGSNKITRNEIAHHSYSGISVGWRWGYAESRAKRNTIESNHIHHIGDGLLSDMGGIYTLGPSEGTTIRNNHIHHIAARTYGGWGLYNDEGSTGILMENNLVTHTRTGGYHQHYGRENIVRNNILAFSAKGEVQLTRAEPHLSFTFERNLVLCGKGPIASGGGLAKGNCTFDHNLYWQTDGTRPDFAGMTWEAWREKGRDSHSWVIDPGFLDPAAGDWRLREGSPASKVGFVPFDGMAAGVVDDANAAPSWRAFSRRETAFRSRFPAF